MGFSAYGRWWRALHTTCCGAQALRTSFCGHFQTSRGSRTSPRLSRVIRGGGLCLPQGISEGTSGASGAPGTAPGCTKTAYMAYICSRVPCSPTPHGMVMVPLDPGPRHNGPPLGFTRLLTFEAYLPFFPHLVKFLQIPCFAIQHHLQRLRLHQPAFTPIHTHQRSTGGPGAHYDHAQGRSDAGAHIYIKLYNIYILY